MSWVQNRISGKRMEMEVNRDERLALPNESVVWITSNFALSSDIQNTCYKRYFGDSSCTKLGLVGFNHGYCTYTEKAIRWACHTHNQAGEGL